MDFLLLNATSAAALVRTGVDTEHRGRHKSSDHAPVWVELQGTASGPA
jgi:exonuclease III